MKSDIATLIDESAYFWQSNKFDEAVECCNKALEIDPDSVGALSNLGATYWGMGRPDDALPILLRAEKLLPTNLPIIQNIATIYQDKGDLDNALKYYERAIELKPRSAYFRWCKGTVLLAMGDYIRGWVFYEEGLGQPAIRGAPPEFQTRQWNGNYCNRLVLWHEQGLGDTLQFIRYAKLAKERVNKVIVLCPKPLMKIVASCPWVDDVTDHINEGEFEQHISIMSMPWLMKTNIDTIPAPIPYLFTDVQAAAKWHEKMKGDKLRVGLVWAGNPRKYETKYRVIDGRRTVTLAQFKPILDVPDIDFYSLQKGDDAEAQLKEFPQIINYMGEVNDFSDTAAMIANLDLVISVDTSVAHLVGAMGRPVWILSRFDACWRWLRNRQDNPWYPSARIWGQTEPGNWEPIVQQIAEVLKTAKVKPGSGN